MSSRFFLRISWCILITVFCCYSSVAQPLTAYVNAQNQVMVWDKNFLRKIDFMPPVEMKIGRSVIPYLDNSRSFKIYYNGGVKTINIGYTNAFYVSDNLALFLNAKSLNVFDKGNIKNLTGICEQYFLADSVIVFLDGTVNAYKAYYNGQVYPIEGFPVDSVLTMKLSDNVVAYNNFARQFRIFYQGNIIAQEDYPVNGFDAGRNTVAYVDINNQFKIFHKGKTNTVEEFPPQNYAVGDNIVAYVSTDGYFKIFYGDTVRTLGYFNPDYQVVDNILAFKDPTGFLKVFYKGEVTTLENYYPGSMKIQYNSLAYVNSANTLRLFTEGEVYDVTNADVESWSLDYDVLKYQIGQNIFKIYYKGTEY
jgi:hypothetical protein